MSITVSSLGFPRIGPRRELKSALEASWSGKTAPEALAETAQGLRAANWQRQKALGATSIPSNDFSLYDHVLDTAAMVGAVPKIYGWTGGEVPVETYFAMARGTHGTTVCEHGHSHGGKGLPAQEMTKWFDTNYHYIVPEFTPGQEFALASSKAVREFREAKALGVHTRPVLVGPVTFLKLGKSGEHGFARLSLLPGLLPVYAEVLRQLAAEGADWVQIDEPVLVLDLTDPERAALKTAYAELAKAVPSLKILVATYFGNLGDNLATAVSLPVAGLHVDLKRGAGQLDTLLAAAPKELALSLGVIDGRNVWRADLEKTLDLLEPVVDARGADGIIVSASCSFLHVPIDLEQETKLDPDVKSWLAFAVQKIEELAILGRALDSGRSAVADALEASSLAAASRRISPKIHDTAVQSRLAAVTPGDAERAPFAERRAIQRAEFGLPAFPTTTIGSFPQTDEVRKARAANTKGQLSDADYKAFLRKATEEAVRWQEVIDVDVLVHGEFERNDMVQYFGEQLSGYAFTQHGWVQSFGSRYVRPPIIFGDVSRPKPMTVEWSGYAQSLTGRPMKGMLTGPVTMLFWSFIRDDIPRADTCRQIALAIRDEVVDLERAGIAIIQIDEPAIREGLPLRRGEWDAYLDWAVQSFRLSASGVKPGTQIHTHMCYSEFNDIMPSIAAMDADVISIETTRSQMELLDAFIDYKYPNEIGPGIYDIHSPRVPSADEMTALLEKARERLSPDQIWVNPDCGLKTRKWDEVKPALENMVAAAKRLRATL
ncbi:5-methyltetrahydropteroyltriglutamate--homocysteine S-methyltransferase [Terrihabitans rhizophilus]|uniref:5-methyltetrahydropteroyltriglutamate--homocysteine methyltransferase n=1 Tax=Terrihabitans rhizophilus TaxID=3092662 RepID=A0ABU4RMR1_9HYPH|nr:5-methyltetrahydropteroyltriglutamate--homocysteine S-methyltransferase [Terrihabitans sp. PJ23]MDX6805015.1 5-methyltetrahydropteroyltriglutamate--homocysteine S-methyltransferase [Terrihabitans sp. PJ23]